MTVVPNATLSYLAVWPSGQAQPNVSTLNSDGRVKANAAITPAGVNGGVTVFATNATQVILDINGYFVPSSNSLASAYYPISPCRAVDTRQTGLFGGPFIAAGTVKEFGVEQCALPANAAAYALNVTAIPHNKLPYLTTWPTGQPQPNVSTLNSPTGEVVANAAIVPAGTNGQISILAYDDTDVVLDLNGYFALPYGDGGLSLYTTTPCRALDTRNSAAIAAGAPLVVNLEGSTCGDGKLSDAVVGCDRAACCLHLNATDGVLTSNMAIVPSDNGYLEAFADGTTNLILDLSGYFAP